MADRESIFSDPDGKLYLTECLSLFTVDPTGAREQLIEWRTSVSLVSERRKSIPFDSAEDTSNEWHTYSLEDVHLALHWLQGYFLFLSTLRGCPFWKYQAWCQG